MSNFLESLLPAIAGIGAGMAFGPLGAAAASGIGTTLVTGDVNKGLTSGLTGYGVGSGLDALAGAAGGGFANATQAGMNSGVGMGLSPLATEPVSRLGAAAAEVGANGLGAAMTPGVIAPLALGGLSSLDTMMQPGMPEAPKRAGNPFIRGTGYNIQPAPASSAIGGRFADGGAVVPPSEDPASAMIGLGYNPFRGQNNGGMYLPRGIATGTGGRPSAPMPEAAPVAGPAPAGPASPAAMPAQAPAAPAFTMPWIPTGYGMNDQFGTRTFFNDGGPVVGPGGPRDDAIPAMVDGRHPARLSSGEFVMPADAVAAMGGGHPARGAHRLNDMVELMTGRRPPNRGLDAYA